MNLTFHFHTGTDSYRWRFASGYAIIAGNSPQDMNSFGVSSRIRASRWHKHCFCQAKPELEMHFDEARCYLNISLLSKGFFIFSESAIFTLRVFSS
jgi:hypothetical protein